MQDSCVHSKWCKGYRLKAQAEHNTNRTQHMQNTTQTEHSTNRTQHKQNTAQTEHNTNRTQHIQCITRHLPRLYVETKRKAIEASKREGKLKLVLIYIRHVCYNVTTQ